MPIHAMGVEARVTVPDPWDVGDRGFLVGLSRSVFIHPWTRDSYRPSAPYSSGYGLYNDSRGNCTVGIGEFLHNGPCSADDSANYPNGEDPNSAMAIFAQQVGDSASDINNNVSGTLTQGQFDALVSVDFNMGFSRETLIKCCLSTASGDRVEPV